MSQKVVWSGTYLDYGGYADMSRTYVRGLYDRGWDMGTEIMKGTEDIPPEDAKFFRSLSKTDNNGNPSLYLSKGVIKIVAFLPLINIPKFKHNVIYTMMESRKVNKNFVKTSNRFYDSCWTPTEYNKRVFEEGGVKIPVDVMPIGINDYNNPKNALPFFNLNYKVYSNKVAPDQPSGFKFLSVFRWSFRKGFDVLLKSFLNEFKFSDDVCLVIHSRHAAMSHDPRFYQYVQNDLGRLYDEYSGPESPPVYLCQELVPSDLMPSLYNIGDCFVSTSRGEGLCIPVLEASRLQKPVIVPNHTGFTDYVREDNCYSFDVDKWVVVDKYNLTPETSEWARGAWITNDFQGQEFPYFGDVASEQVSALMREVYSQPEEAKSRVEKMNDLIDEKYSWPKLLDKAEEKLKEIISIYEK